MKRFIPLMFVLICFIVLMVLHVCLLSSIHNNHAGKLQQLELRVKSLEKTLADSTLLIKNAAPVVSVISDVQVKELQLAMRELEVSLKQDLQLPLSVGIPITLFALLGLAWALYDYVYHTATEYAREEMQKAFTAPHTRIKVESKVLVFSPEKTSEETIMQLLQSSGFQRVYNAATSSTPIPAWKDFDVVLLNDFGDDDLNKLISEILAGAPNVSILSYGSSQIKLEHLSKPNVTSARFLSQVYGNLMNMLDYRRSSIDHQTKT